jgi:hypothetical protein
MVFLYRTQYKIYETRSARKGGIHKKIPKHKTNGKEHSSRPNMTKHTSVKIKAYRIKYDK